MLSHAPRSRFIDPGRPPAADGGLRSQYPDLVLGAQQPLDCRQLRQAGRRVLTRSFDTRSKASIDLAALAIKPGCSEPQLTTSGRARSESGSGSFFALNDLTGWIIWCYKMHLCDHKSKLAGYHAGVRYILGDIHRVHTHCT